MRVFLRGSRYRVVYLRIDIPIYIRNNEFVFISFIEVFKDVLQTG